MFLWNLWWARHTLGSPEGTFFVTHHLFAPFGADLTLHTHTALLGWFGAIVFGRLPLVIAFNLLVIGSLFLNAIAAYLLAYTLTRQRAASILAGVVFGGSPYIMAHLQGHLNLVAAWGLPLFAVCLHRAFADRSRAWSVVGGLVLGGIAYTDYYYLVYASLFGVVYAASPCMGWTLTSARPEARRAGWPLPLLLSLLALDLMLAVGIAATGGGILRASSFHLSMTRPTNALTAAWVLFGLVLLYRFAPVVRMAPHWRRLRDSAMVMTPLVVAAVAVSWPLIANATDLVRRGDYISEKYYWRSSPSGIDPLALIVGNPLHPVWGGFVSQLLAPFHIDVERVGWLGVVPIALLIVAARAYRRTRDPEDQRWWTAGAVFLLWSLGPFLVIDGINTGLFLPAFLVRWLPLLNNARIPGRAMVMVYLAAAVLAARTVAGEAPARRRAIMSAGAVLAVLVDFMAAPFPMYRLPDVPALYYTLRDDSAGPRTAAVCELPLGIRDGFGEMGHLDHSVLYFQTVHQRPLVGGFVARMAPRLRAEFTQNLALSTLLDLSAGQGRGAGAAPATATMVREELTRLGVGYVVVNRATAPEGLLRLVQQIPRMQLLAEEGPRQLFALAGG